MFVVLKRFKDLQDNEHIYNEGDIFPREGVKASVERLAELSSDKNKRGIKLIKFVEDKKEEEVEVKKTTKKSRKK